jgi:hypothetical protein
MDADAIAEAAAKRALARALSPRVARGGQQTGEERLVFVSAPASEVPPLHAIGGGLDGPGLQSPIFGPSQGSMMRRAQSYKPLRKESEGELLPSSGGDDQSLDSQVQQALSLANARAMGRAAAESSSK